MMQVVKQARGEKIAMYMKLSKRELAEMLVNANDALAARSAVEVVLPPAQPQKMESAPWPTTTVWCRHGGSVGGDPSGVAVNGIPQ